MKALLVIFTLLLTALPAASHQDVKNAPSDGEKELQHQWILNDLKVLISDSAKLKTPLAQAAAKAEIADAAWTLDAQLSKQLLTDAYLLTFPRHAPADRGARRDLEVES